MEPYLLAVAKQCVAFLYREEVDGDALKKKAIGTCFFAGRATEERKSVYLVTAKHVYKELIQGDGQIYVRLNVSGPAGGVDYIPLPTEGWVTHADDEVDLIVLPWFPFIQNARVSRDVSGTIMSLPIEVIASAPRYAAEIDKPWPPDECEQVFFVGLLLQHEGTERNYPVFRMGHIALNTDELIDFEVGRSRYRLIESQCYKGNSGAPVWVYYEEPGQRTRWVFLGVLTLGFRSEPDLFHGQNTFSFGISAVVPGEYLVEVLTGLEREPDASLRSG